MRSTGIVRAIDNVGRIVIPMDLRRSMGLTGPNDALEIFVEDDKIILRKYVPSCIFCGNIENVIEYEGQKICAGCIKKLGALAETNDEQQSGNR